MRRTRTFLMTGYLICFPFCVLAEDYFLTIGGGYSPSSNQVSLERNVLLLKRTLRQLGLDDNTCDIYFSDGDDAGLDVQVIDRNSVPKANRLMAEFFGSDERLGLMYRNHRIPSVHGAATPANIRRWFEQVGNKMKSGDRLVLYVTAHGNRGADGSEYDTTIAMWDDSSLKMSGLVELLDRMPAGVEVVAIMVQCYAGGFSRFIYNAGDPDRGLATQRRTGFFATVHDRAAAGCTSEIEEASYVEYSTFFWAALTGSTRTGQTIDVPDYNTDGVVSFDEAHAYTILTADTIDVPIKTSGEFLTLNSRFGDHDSNLLTDEEPYDVVLSLASAAETAILEGLSSTLDLKGSDRVAQARKDARRRRGRPRRRRPSSPSNRLRHQITNDLKSRWPELANVLNPGSIRLVTSHCDEFIRAIENHSAYRRYRELSSTSRSTLSDQKRRAKFERFYRTADNVILAENLRRMNDTKTLDQYREIVLRESGTLGDRRPSQ